MEDRDKRDALVRNVPDDVLARFRTGARARHIEQAEFLERLLDVHAAVAKRAKRDASMRKILESCGMESITV